MSLPEAWIPPWTQVGFWIPRPKQQPSAYPTHPCCSSSCPYHSGSIALCHLFSPWVVMGLKGRDIWSQAHASGMAFACFALFPTEQNFLKTFLSSPLPSPCSPSPLNHSPHPPSLSSWSLSPRSLHFLTSVPCHGVCELSDSFLWYLWQEPNKAFLP